jgi:thiol-disulfide isomerase/thioredoxin
MKNIFFTFIFLFTVVAAKAQPAVAMDFTDDDCNGNVHNLYTTLDSGEVVILEFFMNCGSCIVAGQTITPMFNQLAAQYPGKVNFYAFAYNNTMSCTNANNVISGNGINAIPFDSGASQVAYYGGFGMPTIAVVAGQYHSVLFTNVGFATGDTATMAAAIHNFFATIGVDENATPVSSMTAFPSPASENVQVNFELKSGSDITLQVLNPLGQVVRENRMGEIPAGQQQTTVSVADLNAGVYFIRLNSSEGSITRQIIVE